MPDNDWSWTFDKTLPSRRGAHIECSQQIIDQLMQLGWDGRDLFAVEMTLEETLTNAIRHGNKLDEAKSVQVGCKASPQKFWLRVRDEGAGYSPDAVPDCTAEENIEACGGRGLMLIRAYMTRVTFNEAGNCVTVEKDRAADSSES